MEEGNSILIIINLSGDGLIECKIQVVELRQILFGNEMMMRWI